MEWIPVKAIAVTKMASQSLIFSFIFYMERIWMSLERVIKALIGLGLSRADAEIYVYVAKKETQTVMNLNKALQYSRNQINFVLRNLVTLGLVKKEGKLFFALPFEEALELLIGKKKQNAESLQENKESLIASCKTEE